MKAQRVLYNQLHSSFIDDSVWAIFAIHIDDSRIETGTSAGKISLNIYSKILWYAATKIFIENHEQWKFIHASNRTEWILNFCETDEINEIVVMDSCENYVSKQLKDIKQSLWEQWIIIEILPNTQFLISHEQFKEKYQKPPTMETFYRWMRKETGILMRDGKPEWWEWNYDKHNRKFDRSFVDADHLIFEQNDVRDAACQIYKDDIKKRWKEIVRHFPVDRNEALSLLDHFVHNHLDRFWELEDAMYTSSDFVHHSLLSIPLNFWLLTPQEVIHSVEKRETAINNKEWFIRQVLGWREYMYHWFDHYKDELYEKNFFQSTKKLPDWFWRPEKSTCKMNCVQTVIERVSETGYSHHIERLMIMGNFCLLVWYDPHHVNKRFWEQYADAFERVVSPNVLGMSQYADWWNLATKPYVASANYVNKMSNYCKTCHYDPKEKYWEKACPLNYLYWNFIEKNKEVFVKGRQSFIVNHLKKIDTALIKQQSESFIKTLSDEKN